MKNTITSLNSNEISQVNGGLIGSMIISAAGTIAVGGMIIGAAGAIAVRAAYDYLQNNKHKQHEDIKSSNLPTEFAETSRR